MDRRIAIIGAPSNIGIRPYDDGEARHVNRAPAVLRERGLVRRLGAIDFGDVVPAPYADYARPADRPRNERDVLVYSRQLSDVVAAATAQGRFALVLGGDCSIVLGSLLGAKRSMGAPLGLAYVDAHADFATVEESTTGSAASMALALAVGRGESRLASVEGPHPLVDARHVAVVGRRDGDLSRSHRALAASGILDLPHADAMPIDTGYLAAATMARTAARDVRGFWIQVDVDVLDPSMMRAVDSPEWGGLTADELVRLLTPLVNHPRAVGMSMTIYDPALDPDRSCARLLVAMLESLLVQRDRRRHNCSLSVAVIASRPRVRRPQ
jgi:arginase